LIVQDHYLSNAQTCFMESTSVEQ